VELGSCRPPPSASFAATLAAGGASLRSSSSAPQPVPDPALVAAVCRGISNALRTVVSRLEVAVSCAHSGASIAVAEHCIPTPAQQFNLALASRIDELRVGVCAVFSDFPPPSRLAHVLPVDETDPSITALAMERSRLYPLRPHLPPALLAATHMLRVAKDVPEAELVSQVSSSFCSFKV
jgi:hypothetical protein